MLRIALRFPAGRYHATPWGRHVNEGDIEWPPSPWRICRALIATGFSKEGWTAVPETMAAIVDALAQAPPVYHLPPASAAHTRHYMPLYNDKTAKVIDAFAYPGRDSALAIEWDVELDAASIELIDELLERMGYLGRAESWVEARRVAEVPEGLTPCSPGEAPPGPDHERIGLLAPMPAGDYAGWREHTHAGELARRLENKQRDEASKGKKPPKALSAKERRALEDELPATLVEALCADTAQLQRAGWSQPPGSRWLAYWRHRDALSAGGQRSPRRGRAAGVHTALLALEPDTVRSKCLPPLRDALWRCEAVHRALVRLSTRDGAPPSPCLRGCDEQGRPLQGHRHAMLLPLCLDRAGRIDHIVVHAAMGLDDSAIHALRRIEKTWAKKLPELHLTLVALGRAGDFAPRVPHLDTARTWESLTPFVPPRYLKPSGKNSLLGQVCAELASRGLPEPEAVHVQTVTRSGRDYIHADDFWPLWRRRERGAAVWLRPDAAELAADIPRLAPQWRHFRRVRQHAERKPPIQAGFGLRLTFKKPVAGPIGLGYASHYGLGVFVPTRRDR